MRAAHTADIASAEAEAPVTCTLKDGDGIKLWVLDLLANLVARQSVAITQAVPALMGVLQGLVVTTSALGGEERHLQLASPIAHSRSGGENITLRALAARAVVVKAELALKLATLAAGGRDPLDAEVQAETRTLRCKPYCSLSIDESSTRTGSAWMIVITYTTDEEGKSIGRLAALIEMAFLEEKGAAGLVEALEVFFTEIRSLQVLLGVPVHLLFWKYMVISFPMDNCAFMMGPLSGFGVCF